MFASYNDQQLASEIRRGNRNALAYLVRTTEGPLLQYAEALLPPWLSADDVVQDVYTKILELGRAWNPQCALKPYLYRMVRNRTVDLLRREHRQELLSQRVLTPPAPPFADARVLAHECAQVVVDVLRTLPSRYRRSYMRCELLGHAHAAEAKALGVQVETIRAYLAHARRLFYQELRARGFTVPPRHS